MQQTKEQLWIQINANSPYFEDETGKTWTPIGQNDAVTWPDFESLFKRRDTKRVEDHLAYLKAHGITCIRMMMEYCQTENRYLEKPVGKFQPNMIGFWDDLFSLCGKYEIRLLLTPFDTFWMARRWKYHPYNKLSGGPCKSKWQWLANPEMLVAIKNRFSFFIGRWGGSGTLFAWDLWNEISPVHAGKNMDNLNNFIREISTHIREQEMQLYKKSHLQTVSVFAPVLSQPGMISFTFRNPLLDFASIHMYQTGSLDYPRDINLVALTTGKLVKNALQQMPAGRPFFDSEHGPITYFRRNRSNLPEEFDNRYHLYIQWAHFASGGAGGGMRWPYRHPHLLTDGMRKAQLNLAEFIRLIDFKNFKRVNFNDTVRTSLAGVHVFGCGDENQALLWIFRSDAHKPKHAAKGIANIKLFIPGLSRGNFIIYIWDTNTGLVANRNCTKTEGELTFEFDMKQSNLALAIKKKYE